MRRQGLSDAATRAGAIRAGDMVVSGGSMSINESTAGDSGGRGGVVLGQRVFIRAQVLAAVE